MAAHPFRLSSHAYTGSQRVFLTLCTENRARVFVEAPAVDPVVMQFSLVCSDWSIELVAYCFMPDHVHLLLSTDSQLVHCAKVVRLLKQRSAFAFKAASGLRLWQRSFFDRTLRSDEDTRDVIEYIITNPVRGGLVESVANYPFWGSAVRSREELLDFVASRTRPV